jgi:hypothetical protein
VNKLRWGKFYWSDWADDPALALCSLAAQGLWMRLLCIAAQGTPYGHVTVNGKPPSMSDLAKLVRPRPRTTFVERLIAELERNGVVERAACGCLVSRRMEHDGKVAVVRREAAYEMHARRSQDSCETLLRSQNDRRKAADKADVGSDLHMQNPSFASTESTETHESRIPPVTPRKRGVRGRASMNGGRKESRNAMCDIIAEEMRDAEANDARREGPRVVSIVGRLNRRVDDP